MRVAEVTTSFLRLGVLKVRPTFKVGKALHVPETGYQFRSVAGRMLQKRHQTAHALQLVDVHQAVLGQQRLHPQATDVVAAAGDEHVCQ